MGAHCESSDAARKVRHNEDATLWLHTQPVEGSTVSFRRYLHNESPPNGAAAGGCEPSWHFRHCRLATLMCLLCIGSAPTLCAAIGLCK